MTVETFERASTITEGRTSYIMVRVVKHKTQTTGSAKVTISAVLARRLHAYVKYLRPLLPESLLMFPNRLGYPLDSTGDAARKLT